MLLLVQKKGGHSRVSICSASQRTLCIQANDGDGVKISDSTLLVEIRVGPGTGWCVWLCLVQILLSVDLSGWCGQHISTSSQHRCIRVKHVLKDGSLNRHDWTWFTPGSCGPTDSQMGQSVVFLWTVATSRYPSYPTLWLAGGLPRLLRMYSE